MCLRITLLCRADICKEDTEDILRRYEYFKMFKSLTLKGAMSTEQKKPVHLVTLKSYESTYEDLKASNRALVQMDNLIASSSLTKEQFLSARRFGTRTSEAKQSNIVAQQQKKIAALEKELHRYQTSRVTKKKKDPELGKKKLWPPGLTSFSVRN